MTEKNMARADFYTGIILMAFGITSIVMAFQMPTIERDPYSSPGVLPSFLGFVITGLSLIMFIRSIVRTKGQVGFSGDSIKGFFADIGTRRVLITTVLCVCYALLLGKVLFPLLTFVFVFIFVIVFEYDRTIQFRPQIKKVMMAFLVALISSASITAVFQYLFLVRLP